MISYVQNKASKHILVINMVDPALIEAAKAGDRDKCLLKDKRTGCVSKRGKGKKTVFVMEAPKGGRSFGHRRALV